jgi:L-threonylcarbamoyladenylate synthase
MDPTVIEGMIEQGRDSYEARLAAGQARLKRGEIARAIDHLEQATAIDPDRTMAWQSLGEAYRARGQSDEARTAWTAGLEAAERNGDQQAGKVMGVFLKRLDKLPLPPDPLAVFASGALLGLPTETVYGLAAPIDRPDLVARVFELKGRPADHPLIVHVGTIEQARACTSDWPDAADALSEAFWPGPLTLVLPRSGIISDAITAGQDTVALRMPDHPLALRLLKEAGVAFVAPSANVFTRLSPTRAADVAATFSADDVVVVDGGPCQVGIESTIVALDADRRSVRILRPGMISAAAVAVALPADWRMADDEGEALRAPGQMAAHYRPDLALRVEVLPDAESLDRRARVLEESGRCVVRLPESADEAARQLYRQLREGVGPEFTELVLLLSRSQHQDPAWTGIVNRLTKAASSWVEA